MKIWKLLDFSPLRHDCEQQQDESSSCFVNIISRASLHTRYRDIFISLCQWTVPHLSIIIFYNSTWSSLIQ